MSNIATHFEQLMPLEEQERIGATADRAEHLRVMRVLSEYSELRAKLAEVERQRDWERDRASNSGFWGRMAAKESIRANRAEAKVQQLRGLLAEVMRPHGIYDWAVSAAPKAYADEYMGTGDCIRASLAATEPKEGA